MEQEFKEIF